MPPFRCHVSNAFFQFHSRDAFNNTTSAFASLTRQPLAGFLWRRDEFRFHTRFACRFHHRLR